MDNDNKQVDGIKKISKEEKDKMRQVLLDYIGEGKHEEDSGKSLDGLKPFIRPMGITKKEEKRETRISPEKIEAGKAEISSLLGDTADNEPRQNEIKEFRTVFNNPEATHIPKIANKEDINFIKEEVLKQQTYAERVKAEQALARRQAFEAKVLEEKKKMLEKKQAEMERQRQREIETEKVRAAEKEMLRLAEERKQKQLEDERIKAELRRKAEEQKKAEEEKRRLEEEKKQQEEARQKQAAEEERMKLLKKEEKERQQRLLLEERAALREIKRKLRKERFKKMVRGLKAGRLRLYKKIYSIFAYIRNNYVNWVFMAGILAFLLVLAYLLFALYLIKFHPTNKFFRLVESKVTVPVLISSAGTMGYFDYLDAKSAWQMNSGMPNSDSSQFKKDMVEVMIMEKLAEKYGLKNMSSAEIRKFLSNKAPEDDDINSVGMARAKKIKDLIKNNDDFAPIATKYGDKLDKMSFSTAAEAGWNYGQAVSDLKPGEVSGIITRPDGYYIFRRYDNNGQFALSYVFIKGKTLDEYLNEKADEIKAWMLIE